MLTSIIAIVLLFQPELSTEEKVAMLDSNGAMLHSLAVAVAYFGFILGLASVAAGVYQFFVKGVTNVWLLGAAIGFTALGFIGFGIAHMMLNELSK